MKTISFSLALIGLALPFTASGKDLVLTEDLARKIVSPFYEALNRPATKDLEKLLKDSTSPDWQSCAGNSKCADKAFVIKSFRARGDAIPDLKWDIVDIKISGNTVIVRSEASGTPIASFMGANTTGKSFKIMAIDIHTIENQKMAKSYHIEDWAGVVRQVNEK